MLLLNSIVYIQQYFTLNGSTCISTSTYKIKEVNMKWNVAAVKTELQ